jgi:hypothetical protein
MDNAKSCHNKNSDYCIMYGLYGTCHRKYCLHYHNSQRLICYSHYKEYCKDSQCEMIHLKQPILPPIHLGKLSFKPLETGRNINKHRNSERFNEFSVFNYDKYSRTNRNNLLSRYIVVKYIPEMDLLFMENRRRKILLK